MSGAGVPASPRRASPAAPRDDDGASIDGIIRAIYETISGPAGPRDWDRERRLFLPGAVLMPSKSSPAATSSGEVLDLEGYIVSRSPFFERNSFYEIEIARRTFVFGDKAQVLSAYEGRPAPEAAPSLRGINAIQLVHDGRRWWILSIAWENETADHPLPDLKTGDGWRAAPRP